MCHVLLYCVPKFFSFFKDFLHCTNFRALQTPLVTQSYWSWSQWTCRRFPQCRWVSGITLVLREQSLHPCFVPPSVPHWKVVWREAELTRNTFICLSQLSQLPEVIASDILTGTTLLQPQMLDAVFSCCVQGSSWGRFGGGHNIRRWG